MVVSRGAFVPEGGQFGQPTGAVRWVAGRLMARTNEPMNQVTFELLGVQPGDRVLEIGFGPGRLIHQIARRVTAGFVAGVDCSEVMVRQAARLNREFIQQRRVQLIQSTVSRLPFQDRWFTKACAVNSLQFWPAPAENLREVWRVLKLNGLLVLGLRMKNPARRFIGKVGFTEAEVQEVLHVVRGAGFRDVRTDVRHLSAQEAATYVLARR